MNFISISNSLYGFLCDRRDMKLTSIIQIKLIDFEEKNMC